MCCDSIGLASFTVVDESVAMHFHADREELDDDIMTGYNRRGPEEPSH